MVGPAACVRGETEEARENERVCGACAERVQSVHGACELGRAGSVCKVGEFAI